MRLLDLLSLPLSAFWQQKVRTILATLGVVFGSFVLAASLSVGQGVQDLIARNMRRNDLLRKIVVEPQWRATPTANAKPVDVPGNLSPERKARLEKLMSRDADSGLTPVHLNADKLKEIAALPHAELVIPIADARVDVILGDQAKSVYMRPSRPENPDGQRRIVEGRFFETPNERSVIVNEFILYRLGLINDADLRDAIGRQLRIEFRPIPKQQESGFGIYLIRPDHPEMTRAEKLVLEKIQAQLPALVPQMALTTADLLVLKNTVPMTPIATSEPIFEDLTIVGIQRDRTPDEEQKSFDFDSLTYPSDIVLPYQTAADLMSRADTENQQGLQRALLIVDDEKYSEKVVEQVSQMGLRAYAPLEHIRRERLMYLLIFGGMSCVAAVALLVAALGIANTMLMSILERTREIGIMKAVGAGNGTLQFIFLLEGALIGLLGGGCGLLAAWGASFPGDAYVRNLVTRDLKIDLNESIFVFPPWLAVIVMTFAVLVTTLAAVFPARRAARIDPIKALRHE